MNRSGLFVALALAISCSGSETVPPPASLSSDATLSSLAVSAGALNPAFSGGTHQYALAVPFGTGIVRVTPTANDSKALSVGVRQDNLALFAVGSGNPSGGLAVPALGASSKITVRVTAQDGTEADYIITLTQSSQLSSDATLSALAVSAGTMAPAFDPALHWYMLSVPNGTASVTVTPAQHDASATSITVRQDGGNWVGNASGAASAALTAPAVGGSSTITVRVTAQDGTTSDYVLTYTQAPPVAPAAFTIYAVGDSTMADYSPTISPPQAGWGQMFRNFLLGTQAAYVNAARNGRSSKSFYDEGSWANSVASKLKSGDTVFIQFAHNDESDNGLDGADGVGTAPFGGYQTYLRKYVDEARAAGATPILITPVVRRYFAGSTITPKGAHDLTGVGDPSIPAGQDLNYVEAMKQVATEKGVALVDLTASTKTLVEQYGPTDSKAIIYIAADDTHLQPLGATLFAQLAVQGLIAQGILTSYLNPAGDLIVSPSSIDFGTLFDGNTLDQTISVTGLSISPDSGNVTVTAPAGYTVGATSTGTFAASLQIPYTGGRLAPTTVYVRFAPTLAQVYSGNVTIAPPTGNSKSVAVTGTGQAPTTGGTESAATYSLTADDNCAATGLATCTEETYSNLYVKNFGTVNATNTSVTWIPSVPANDHVERVSIVNTTTADQWPGSEVDIDPTRYVQFTMSPAPGKSWAVDQISLWAGAAGGSNLGFKIYYSKASDFSGATLLVDASSNAKDTMIFQTLPLALTINAGETLYIRAFPWLRGAAATGKYMCLQSLTVHGTAQ